MEPHKIRRNLILKKYPQIRQLFGNDISVVPQIICVCCTQLYISYIVSITEMKIVYFIIVSYCIGGALSQNLFLANHELSHNLVFSKPLLNKILSIIVNIPFGIPYVTHFQKYHIEHHLYQGKEGIDMDLPSTYEQNIVGNNKILKLLWVTFQLVAYAVRPMLLRPKRITRYDIIVTTIIIITDYLIIKFWSIKALLYLITSGFLGGGFHPFAGHFISEHYVFKEGQETYSYYGSLNSFTYNVGYHNEHHDFPRIPGSRLRKVKEICPEYYESLYSHKSWCYVIWEYITKLSPSSRIIRNQPLQ